MQYVAIDLHKRYSVVSALNEQGQRTREARIDGNSAAGFAQFFKSLEDRSKVVIEATWNWGRVHDLLESIEEVEEVVLAHPYKTRIIAEAQVKTDKLDARALAKLLRADLVARAYIPSVGTRRRKEVLRQRLFWVRVEKKRTGIFSSPLTLRGLPHRRTADSIPASRDQEATKASID